MTQIFKTRPFLYPKQSLRTPSPILRSPLCDGTEMKARIRLRIYFTGRVDPKQNEARVSPVLWDSLCFFTVITVG